MMQAINLWPVAAALALLALFATLRLSIPHARTAISGYGLGIVAHPAWLMPVMLGMPMAVGFMMTGALSPWPPEAASLLARTGGGWAGVAGFLTALVVDLWLLWTPSIVALDFTAPETRAKLHMLPLLNLLLGGFFLALFYLLAH
jgi:hypothetical protein